MPKRKKSQRKKKSVLVEVHEEFIACQLAYILDGIDYYDPVNPPNRQFETSNTSGNTLVLHADCGDFLVTVTPLN